ncbi:dihydroorotate dehydrogenase-like protein [Ruficoccus amylovorans]|uniref:Dihydroorotate dehydrogenase-like protein n=1 Tax=Ruficoccus amylovorans TaxID=1804625 RepID=A0A842HGU7_9BACT|nr:dihydroorotate dehydrogenase-like protein [Ruficoccus amylovorans]MBC2594784.1 dihydroorotate dehydrogenase-like protein [Ruficoccus amylovorans]
MDLKTTYLGLELPHPFVVGASPIAARLDRVRLAEDAGAAAIVMNSLFEEQIIHHEEGLQKHVLSHEDSFAEATSYFPSADEFDLGPDEYLERIREIKQAVDIPVIASLNGTNLGTWTEYAKYMEEAGADALELNLYYQPRSAEESSEQVEGNFVEIVEKVRQSVKLPLAVKLSPFFSSLPNFIKRIEDKGANAAVIFNRFYQPDIDIENLEAVPSLKLSDSSELLLRLRWLAILSGRTQLDLAVTGGVHTAEDAIKAVMAGADCIQLVSTLLRHGLPQLTKLRNEMAQWMEEKEYDSLEQMKGSMSYQHAPNPEAIERANYLRILQSWDVEA